MENLLARAPKQALETALLIAQFHYQVHNTPHYPLQTSSTTHPTSHPTRPTRAAPGVLARPIGLAFDNASQNNPQMVLPSPYNSYNRLHHSRLYIYIPSPEKSYLRPSECARRAGPSYGPHVPGSKKTGMGSLVGAASTQPQSRAATNGPCRRRRRRK
uniref:Uncharacterized protein n=1 Tax=Opuntia streptacantha TaxID=393608 RepID=A0A7C9EAG7_OPUST